MTIISHHCDKGRCQSGKLPQNESDEAFAAWPMEKDIRRCIGGLWLQQRTKFALLYEDSASSGKKGSTHEYLFTKNEETLVFTSSFLITHISSFLFSVLPFAVTYTSWPYIHLYTHIYTQTYTYRD